MLFQLGVGAGTRGAQKRTKAIFCPDDIKLEMKANLQIWNLPGEHGTARSRAGGSPVLENTLALVMKRAVPSLLLLLLNAAARVLALTVASSGSRMATSRTRLLADSSQAAVPLTATAACPSKGALHAAVSRSVGGLGCVVVGGAAALPLAGCRKAASVDPTTSRPRQPWYTAAARPSPAVR